VSPQKAISEDIVAAQFDGIFSLSIYTAGYAEKKAMIK